MFFNLVVINILNMEKWKDVPGFEGRYQVSNRGRVRSLDQMKKVKNGGQQPWPGRVLKTPPDNYGYPCVNLGIGNKNKVHRLVAVAFLYPVKGKDRVNHIDGVKSNNDVRNLEWCTPREDILHAYRTGLRKPRGPIKS